MAAITATISSNQSSTVGPYPCEFTLGADFSVANGTTATTGTLTLPVNGSGSSLNPNLPITACFLTPGGSGGIQGGSNTGLPAHLGLTSVSLSGTTLSLVFTNNNGASPIVVPSGTRVLLMQNQGV
jgi:hypothetical protein